MAVTTVIWFKQDIMHDVHGGRFCWPRTIDILQMHGDLTNGRNVCSGIMRIMADWLGLVRFSSSVTRMVQRQEWKAVHAVDSQPPAWTLCYNADVVLGFEYVCAYCHSVKSILVSIIKMDLIHQAWIPESDSRFLVATCSDLFQNKCRRWWCSAN